MKNFLSIVLIIGLFSCQEENKIDYVIVSGVVENPTADTIFLNAHDYNSSHLIPLNADHSFRDTLRIREGYYSLKQPKVISTEIYLKPGFDLQISLNTEQIQQVSYSGKGSGENNFLAKKNNFGKDIKHSISLQKNNKDRIIILLDSLKGLKNDLLLKYQNTLDKNFEYIESKNIELDQVAIICSMRHLQHGLKGYRLADTFPDLFKNIAANINNEKLLISPSFLPYLKLYFDNLLTKEIKKVGKVEDLYMWYLNSFDREIKNPKIKDETIFFWKKMIFPYIGDPEELDRLISHILSLISDENYKIELREKLEKLRKTKKGAAAPLFELYDYNDDLVKLEDLKGKVVYIDIWATWCGPCKAEIPHLKKLEAHFKGQDISFVSIAYKDKKEKWMKMVEDKNMGGIQLFAPDANIPFFTDFDVSSIPRFILLNKEGKIISPETYRPSYPQIIEFIEAFL
jgi:thiol-disulfide isomerase/thioredoxin